MRLERSRCNRRGTLGGEPGSFEVELDPCEAPGSVEQEDREQLTQVGFVEQAQKIPSSCAAVTASARRETPSLS